jgi:ribosome-binding ATPase YchF (GTP1/OBG family)
MLRIGIVGLPNVGKSTLFNALTNAGALAANYPFATIEPNVGVVAVPDARLGVLAKMYQTEKVVPATVQFVDIAGLVAGASKGEGLGNKFLANIRECEAICHVVRAFSDDSVVRHDVLGYESGILARAKEDIEVIKTELELADLETRERVEGKRKKAGAAEEIVPYLMEKPVVYMFNMDEGGLHDEKLRGELAGLVGSDSAVFVNARLEEEMAGLSGEEKAEFLASYEILEDGLGQLVRVAYSVLGLQSFLTAGKKEVRAWTVRKGATAPEAAGVIHTDFQRGFIAAAVCSYEDLVRLGSEKAVREAGLMRTEGKGYVMREGDVVEFRFNV